MGFPGITDEIIINTLKCPYCDKEFHCYEGYWRHYRSDSIEVANPVLRFGNALLAVGAGLMEKNLILAIFKLCKDVLLHCLAHLVGFRTEKAK